MPGKNELQSGTGSLRVVFSRRRGRWCRVEVALYSVITLWLVSVLQIEMTGVIVHLLTCVGDCEGCFRLALPSRCSARGSKRVDPLAPP